MVAIIISDSLKQSYPDSVFGNLIAKNLINKKSNSFLEDRKRDLEKFLRKESQESSEDEILNKFKRHFKRWDKSYPIEFQINSINNGKNLPKVSVLVDSMFHSELKNRILTSGHDLDKIEGDLIFDLTKGNENYIKINGKDQQLKEGDILLKDDKGILANILYGPAKHTTITMNTTNALYFAWCPIGIESNTVKNHLEGLLSNLELVHGKVLSEIVIY